MGISLKPTHLNRYRHIAWLLMKYGRSDLVSRVVTWIIHKISSENVLQKRKDAMAQSG